MTVAATMRSKLEQAFTPALLEIVDESHRHVGHAGHSGAGESHFQIRIVAPAFEGKSRVERQRLVYGVLAEELAGPVHALALTVRTPAEAAV
ncbi:BolA family protein [Oceanibaculum pacificum]|uniref:BolA family transcriptional regulator n=1 Tax=Oceanibaculum pacificum TaxID=580166 RepID=A0A154WFK5_9PROT|nr:BolA family protein [Oceanibaculum pacificum]KZD12313.1 hypothetical protein AUP43_04895 [Oceanibaculum pacificum]